MTSVIRKIGNNQTAATASVFARPSNAQVAVRYVGTFGTVSIAPKIVIEGVAEDYSDGTTVLEPTTKADGYRLTLNQGEELLFQPTSADGTTDVTICISWPDLNA